MSVKTVTISDGSSKVTVGKVAHGLMNMTWTAVPTSDEEAFEVMKTSLDSVPPGVKLLINSGEFYGVSPREANLELIARFFEKYPSYAEKAFLSVKGGTKADTLEPDSSAENLKRSVDCVLTKLRGTKKLDLFESARVASNVPVEDAIKTLSGFVSEGKFDYIGMSECSAESLRRGHSIHPIAAVEIEVSVLSYEEETKKVIATAKELGIAVVAYSPLGRGFLSGKFKKLDDLDENNMLRHFSRFKEEAMKANYAFAEEISELAQKKGITPAQFCIAWVSALGPHVIPLPGSSTVKRTIENLAANDVELNEEDLATVSKFLETHTVVGDRYFGNDKAAHLWG